MHNKGNKDTKSSKWQTEQQIKASPRNLAPVLQNIADQGEEEASNFHLVWYVKGVLPVYQKKNTDIHLRGFQAYRRTPCLHDQDTSQDRHSTTPTAL